jgi:WD40 repeat protein
MTEIICQVGNQSDRVEFIWSSRGGFFKPYVVTGTQLAELRQTADQTRKAMAELVFTLNEVGSASAPWEPSFKLVEAGSRLYNKLLPGGDDTALKVRHWLEDVRQQSGSIGLEVVVEERSGDPGAFLSVPWNLVYDECPDDHEESFQAGRGTERWRPFWAIRYNLTTGRRVEPWKRLPVWSDPRVIVVIDPTVLESLHEEQRRRLDQFLTKNRLAPVGSIRDLKASLRVGYPQLLYWLGHATHEFLYLGDAEKIHPSDLRNLLSSYADRERPEGMLAFLNACQTAESGPTGSFLDVLHSFGFMGAIATDRQTIDNFANRFGLAFLRRFLRGGRPLGEILHRLRLATVPLGLVYGAHCPPEIRVRGAHAVADAPPNLPIRETAGVALGEAILEGDRSNIKTTDRARASLQTLALPPLPDEPYRSLDYYDEQDRALFTGRDADVVRFAATLDRPDTRILILHGESGLGKSSFLRAGVIPYLENECVGYKFFRRPDGSLLIVQAAKDLIGGLAQALLDATAAPLHYNTPVGEPLAADLRQVLDEVLGRPADHGSLRQALRCDACLLSDILAKMAARLPHALVLVLDQAEDIFTLVRDPEEVAGRDQALRLLQRVVDVQADIKVIVSLRTEYYGRLLDHLRDGRRDLAGVRDDLLRELSKHAIVQSIERPTRKTPLAEGQLSPYERYGFSFDRGVANKIAEGVLALRTENRDSVLPLVQVLCTRLYEREISDPNSDRVITHDDLHIGIGGIAGGLRAYAEDALTRVMRLGPKDVEAFQALAIGLFREQADKTLTTLLVSQDTLAEKWTGERDLNDVLVAACDVRLLRVDSLRIEGEEPRVYVRLGHDALARVAADWKAEREKRAKLEEERRKGRRRALTGIGVALVPTLVLGVLLFQQWQVWNARDELQRTRAEAKNITKVARKKEADAEARVKEAETKVTDAEAKAKSLDEAAKGRVADAETRARRIHEESKAAVQAADEKARRSMQAAEDEAKAKINRAIEKTQAITSRANLDVENAREREREAKENVTVAQQRLQEIKAESDRLANESRMHRLTMHALAHLDDQLDLAMLLCLHAFREHPSDETRFALVSALEHSPHLVTYRDGHDDPIRGVRYSPDGQKVASFSENGEVMLWDMEKLELVGPMGWNVAAEPSGPPKIVQKLNHLDFAEGSRALIGVADGQRVVRWDLAATEGESPRMLQPVILYTHPRPLTAMALLHGPQRVVLADVEGRLHIGELQGERLINVRFVAGARTAVVAPNQRYPRSESFLTVLDDGRLFRLSPAPWGGWGMEFAGQFPARVMFEKWHTGGVTSFALSPDEQVLATGGRDRVIGLWETRTGKNLGRLVGHLSEVTGLAFDPYSRTLVSVGLDKALIVWRLKPTSVFASLERPTCVAYNSTGRVLVVGDVQGRLTWLYTESGKPAYGPVQVRMPAVSALAVSPDGRWLAAGADDGTVHVWEGTTGRPERTVKVEGRVEAVALASTVAGDPSAGRLAVAHNQAVRLWRLGESGEPRILESEKSSSVFSLAFHPGGRMLASGWSDGAIHLWLLDTKPTATLLERHHTPVRSLAFSADGGTLASGSDSGVIVRWSVAERGLIPPSPIGDEGPVQRSKEAHGEIIEPSLTGHKGAIRSLIFLNGQTLVSASDQKDGDVLIWGGDRSVPLATLNTTGLGSPLGLIYARERDVLVLAGADAFRRIDLDEKGFERRVHDLVHRNLNDREWPVYFPGRERTKTFDDLPRPNQSMRWIRSPSRSPVPSGHSGPP